MLEDIYIGIKMAIFSKLKKKQKEISLIISAADTTFFLKHGLGSDTEQIQQFA